ncbi:hypothetical protein [Halomonas urumqiensis]|uniref:Uncharacterized protein n=1 Tax=Halomonas urumqiensis TaxID=1684789 RepID=A0A2N7UFB0_9GAMM|nr:hypothetical protein [Halomonas urumqiensis]PMR79113.1 hypothetical protein C1H70_12455 [Halomonas urumqiensis]PTB03787.1 hypothetical protein C6V82_04740 [Halomonas urumqiensis]GHE19983.1 hypothetical protein GCM10017767_05040 [Halomonas urumqiensis]
MCLPTPDNSARSGPCGLPLWLGMALMLVLLMVVSASQAHAHPWALSGSAEHQTQTDWALALDAMPSARQLAAPTEHPHCHHGQGFRHASAALPRSETADPAPDLLILMLLAFGPSPHVINALGAPRARPRDRASPPLYLLTQRFRS